MVFLDSFTPKTIKKYTGHLNGAVYGSPRKIKNGKTPVNNLFICGTDQGFLGIIGATLRVFQWQSPCFTEISENNN
ncbi:MAG: hypothetical protein Ct9H300mP23_01870 [Nitrospinota bacterium]|nr:MAG: hypothetical protein Ct9H300mP23_01870 [Nitrospinota bacterium]